MIQLDSKLENREQSFDEVRHILHEHDFTLGGNWDYEHGCFDHSLDGENKVWLRIPFNVTYGALDGDTESTDAMIQLGAPFVLKHVYNEGLDPEAKANVTGALVDQFQEPLDPDAEVEPKWVDKAKSVLNKVERSWLH